MVQEVDGFTNWGSTSRKWLDSFNYKAQYDQIAKRELGLKRKAIMDINWKNKEYQLRFKDMTIKHNHSKMDLKDITIRKNPN